MKIQSLAIIFIIIIMPITIVLSEYVNNKLTIAKTELEYNTRLLNSTYDAIKAYQLNTVNNAFGDVSTSKVKDIEAAAKTFLNSISTNFNQIGYNSNNMQSYVPAIAFTLYDGYYIYAPFCNTLTEVDASDYDDTYSKDGEILYGLKPYVYYSCRYINDTKNWDFIITYTLDNYITIQGLIGTNYIYDCGYLYSIANSKIDADNHKGIFYNSLDNTYYYEGVTFSENDTEELKEYIGENIYSYVKIDGTKYYLERNNSGSTVTINGSTFNSSDQIFYIDDSGEKNYSATRGGYNEDPEVFLKYYFAITRNKSSYEYYKHAYEFSKAVLTNTVVSGYKDKAGTPITSGYNLSSLTTADADIYNPNPDKSKTDITNISEYGSYNIFTGNPQDISSNFNKHRKSVIRYIVETNLSTSISSFKERSHSDIEFLMPKISETDWEIIVNNISGIAFLQGLNLSTKKYNGYAVVANTLTKEYIDEDDIYILANDGTNYIYCKPNDKTLVDGTVNIMAQGNNTNELSYYPGIWKLNFEQKQDITTGKTIYYNPINYLGSYTSIMGVSGINGTTSLVNSDIYTYMQSSNATQRLKEIYYKALGRERWGAFNINNVNYELYGNNNTYQYFLNDYEV